MRCTASLEFRGVELENLGAKLADDLRHFAVQPARLENAWNVVPEVKVRVLLGVVNQRMHRLVDVANVDADYIRGAASAIIALDYRNQRWSDHPVEGSTGRGPLSGTPSRTHPD